MSTVTPTKVTALRSELELDGDRLRVIAVGKTGYLALGTHEREIDLGRVRAISFEPANVLKNGSLVLVDERGKTDVHFRRKSNAEMCVLYETICTRVPVETVAASTEGVGLVHKDLDAWHDRTMAELEAYRRGS
jgi:hypothetical protein